MQLISEKYKSFIINRLAEIFGVIFFGLAFFLFGLLISYSPLDPSLNNITDQVPINIFGITGASIADISIQIFGSASYLFLFFLLTWAYRLIIFKSLPFFAINFFAAIICVLLFDLSLLILKSDLFHGFISSYFFLNFIEVLVLSSNYLLGVISVISILFLILFFIACALTFDDWKKIFLGILFIIKLIFKNSFKFIYGVIYKKNSLAFAGRSKIDEEKIEPKIDFDSIKNESVSNYINTDSISVEISQKTMSFKDDDSYVPPIIDILSVPKTTTGSLVTKEEMDNNASKLQAILGDFKIDGEIINVSPGPVVTMYELQPAPGTKASKIIGLSDDIARNMSAVSARVAVIPGKNVIGIEMPNKTQEAVYLSELFKKEKFVSSEANLLLALGKDIAGKAFFADLATMPHLLIAGTTGSGKSVGINVMILSILYRLSPDECKFILIDPKMLELSVYQGIPHLIAPVVTNPKKAITALKWVVKEMEGRYQKMSLLGVRNIESYNQRIKEAVKNKENIVRKIPAGLNPDTGQPKYENIEIELNKMPFIVVVVDEMADLMMVAGKEVESLVQRLAQMARASGIHLITATQRPSVDVITGTIKANFPSRISYKVSSKFDSRTILNEMGAEQLLGSGDMLFLENGGVIKRLHGGFVSESEVDKVVTYIKSQATFDYKKEISLAEEEFSLGTREDLISSNNDDLYSKAVDIVVKQQKVSTSYIQRYLQIGYNRAARIVEKMEEDGIISEANNSGKRHVLKK